MKTNSADLTPSEALLKAVNLLGGQTAVAGVCKAATGKEVKQSHVYNWINRDKMTPPEHAVAIEVELAGKGFERVTRQQLCPDFPWHLVGSSGCSTP